MVSFWDGLFSGAMLVAVSFREGIFCAYPYKHGTPPIKRSISPCVSRCRPNTLLRAPEPPKVPPPVEVPYFFWICLDGLNVGLELGSVCFSISMLVEYVA